MDFDLVFLSLKIASCDFFTSIIVFLLEYVPSLKQWSVRIAVFQLLRLFSKV